MADKQDIVSFLVPFMDEVEILVDVGGDYFNIDDIEYTFHKDEGVVILRTGDLNVPRIK